MNAHPYDSLWQQVIGQFALPPSSLHGPGHWRRVEQNGLKLAQRSGARVDVVRLFAVFHDSRRQNEFTDPQHGPRGAELAHQWRGRYFEIDDAGFELLHTACTVHTDLFNSPDATIGTCLDADRLDLGRVGIIPKAKFMSTAYGKELCAAASPSSGI